MKSSRHYLLPALAAISLVPAAWAEQKEVTIRRLDTDGPRHGMAFVHRDGQGPEVEQEKVAFLGVETAPVSRTLAAQLGLARDTGLVVTHIAEKSPAAEALKEDDVLTKLDDQLLVNQQQLGVLVRARKEGDEVKLTVVRGGKETTVKAKLATREVPKLAGNFFNAPGGMGWTMAIPSAGLEKLRGMPGMNDDDARDVLRIIGREHRDLVNGPRVRVFQRGGRGATILDLPNSNISYSDDEGAIDIKSEEGKRELTVKDAQGKVTFQGPISTPDERKKLPPEVMKRLQKLDDDSISFESGGQFEREVRPLPPEPAKTKIRHGLAQPGRPALRPI